MEMEEGEIEWEEGEAEMMELPDGDEEEEVSADSDDEGDEPPKLVPIESKKPETTTLGKRTRAQMRAEASETSSFDETEEMSLDSSMGTESLEALEEEHGMA